MKLGWAAGRILANDGKGPILIGKDTRVSGYMFESALEAGLSAAGVDIHLLGPMPTPGIAFLAKNTRAQAGIVISASHNPFQDNGIKFFSIDGTKLPDHIELAIEAEMDQSLKVVEPVRLGKARRIIDAPRRYIEFCKSQIDSTLDLSGLSIVLDCAHGATYHIAPPLFEELGARVIAIGVEPDGFNINRQVGATYPETIQKRVIETGADLGIAFDGDGDRVIMVDNKGKLLDGDDILYIIACEHIAQLNGAVVGTLMSNLGLEQAINAMKLDFLRAKVGDRYIMELLYEKNLILGGETSGHLINLSKTTTGDGIITALDVLQAVVATGKGLDDLRKGFNKFPQKMINIRVTRQIDPLELSGIPDAVRNAEQELGKLGRVLVRTSGTEPLIRVMVEGEDTLQVENIAGNLAREIEAAVSQSV